MRNIIIYLSIILTCILIICFSLSVISHSAPLSVKNKVGSSPYYFVRPSRRWGEITDFAVCGETLYVLFGGKETLDCYSLDGTYLHSYFVELGKKGIAKLYVNDDTLYLKDKEFTFYTFYHGRYITSFDVPAAELHLQIEALADSKYIYDGMEYKLRDATIWRSTRGINEDILRRPAWMAVFQGGILLILGSFCFVILCVIIYYLKRA